MNLHCLVSPRAIVGCSCGCRYRVEKRIILFHSPWTASPTAGHKSRYRTATSHKKIKYTKSRCTYRSISAIKISNARDAKHQQSKDSLLRVLRQPQHWCYEQIPKTATSSITLGTHSARWHAGEAPKYHRRVAAAPN